MSLEIFNTSGCPVSVFGMAATGRLPLSPQSALVRSLVATSIHSEPKSFRHGRQVLQLIKRRLATGEIRHADRIVLANIPPRIGMNLELTEEDMRRALFGADEPVAQDITPPVQKPRAIS